MARKGFVTQCFAMAKRSDAQFRRGTAKRSRTGQSDATAMKMSKEKK